MKLSPERRARIGRIAELIAHHPGCTRKELAESFGVSERQMQADLAELFDAHITGQATLLLGPRRHGYRYQLANLERVSIDSQEPSG